MTEARMALLEAVARRRVVTALYNGVTMKLAPHLLFERHGDLFVSAWNMTKNARPENEPKLGHFKLGGLSDVALTEQPMHTHVFMTREQATLLANYLFLLTGQSRPEPRRTNNSWFGGKD
ncbi:MAG: hypothetical protein NVSMB69_05180 [Novosphingobium sp.]